jgi:hypothetical protein
MEMRDILQVFSIVSHWCRDVDDDVDDEEACTSIKKEAVYTTPSKIQKPEWEIL